MRLWTIILAMTMLLLATVPTFASNEWARELPETLGKCEKRGVGDSYKGTGIIELISYITQKPFIMYQIKTKDGNLFDVVKVSLGAPQTTLKTGINLQEVQYIIKLECTGE